MKSIFAWVPGSGGVSYRKNVPFKNTGFTLVELVAVIACVTTLAVLCLGALQSATSSAYKIREINAARLLVTAYSKTAADGNGRYLPGMDGRVNTSSNPVYKSDGQMVSSPVAARRYAYRLAPYLGDSFNGTILVNKNIGQIQKMTLMDADYYISAYPALGMNVFCVGGVVVSDGTLRFSSDCVTTPARMRGSLLVFASAGEGTGGNKVDGYSYVSPPTANWDSPLATPWPSVNTWKEGADPANFGHVDFRYDGKAVCAFFDGSVRMCLPAELADMRVWSPNAAEADDPNWTLQNL